MTALRNIPAELTPQVLWAKLQRDDSGKIIAWHSLLDHSADVAAVVEALLAQPTLGRRLAAAAQTDLDPVTCSRLAALAFLHDIGKANRGFRARVDPKAPPIGHIDQVAWIFHGDERVAGPIRERLSAVLGLERMEPWFTEASWPLFDTLFAHHGRPWRTEHLPDGEYFKLWNAIGQEDPVADLRPMAEALGAWFPEAFLQGPTLPAAPLFHHAFAGLLMLADWVGSDEGFFPYACGACPNRMAFARQRAPEALLSIGIDAEPGRALVQTSGLDFAATFAVAHPRPIQEVIAEPDANLLVLESETGSGKTEAALWRFAHLFERNLVDGLYFALPTRVAATQMFERIKRFRNGLFANPARRPIVVLAVPGQIRADDAEGRLLPGFEVQWDDDPEGGGGKRARWAAEHPKRFLAAPIAAGTVDQALLGTIAVKHAHLRGTALLRHLLVVDEVHASDRYMEALLAELLRSHTAAGGHALLLSATLGSGMLARLLGTGKPPTVDIATAAPYPALSWAEDGHERRQAVSSTGRQKTVALDPRPLIDDPRGIAALAFEAASCGAKVLVLRNTVGAAIQVAEAVEDLARAESPLLFRVAGVATVHHSRFSPDDRRLLDRAVEARVGRERPQGGLVVTGTQTLEISLDLDADLLITDLCPVDVLLQRIGRLHRHAGRNRPSGFDVPRAVVLTPRERDLAPLTRRSRHGLGLGVYDDLRIIEATWRQIEARPRWGIPAMNRHLVEAATHPERLAAIEDDLSSRDSSWRQHFMIGEGKLAAELFAASHARLDRSQPFVRFRIDADERLTTRLGAKDCHVPFDPAPLGPFGVSVASLRIPFHLLGGSTEDDQPEEIVQDAGRFTFRLGAAVFNYNRFGLRRATLPNDAPPQPS